MNLKTLKLTKKTTTNADKYNNCLSDKKKIFKTKKE